MAKKKIYVIFDYKDNQNYRSLLQTWELDPNFDFVFNDPKPVESESVSRIKAEITRKMKDSKCCLVLIGRDTHKNEWLSWEIENANKLGLILVAVKIDKSFKEPEVLLGKQVSWAVSFKQDSIINALNKDEFDKAGDIEKFSLDFWDMLRSYAQRQILTFVIASRHPLAEIEPIRNTSPFSNIFTVINLGSLTNYESKKLINELLEGTIRL